jgi:DNA-binding NtrC family response regulator
MDQLIELRSPSKEGLEIGQLATIGRDLTNTLVVNEPEVSPRHARIERRNHALFIRDLRSESGTFLNSSQVIEAKLNHGDILRIGGVEWRFLAANTAPRESFELSSRNPIWAAQLAQLPAAAKTELPVLITGPSGSGKELLARFIHDNSQRRHGRFVALNCSALSSELVESELFGHVRGAFTDASRDRRGAFEEAHRGTLFLDEIGDLPLHLQPKLLRALENAEVKPVGADRSRQVDVRIIAATHQDLSRRIANGEFRSDLFFRLNVLRLNPPALRDRPEDFESLLYTFCRQYRVAFSHTAILRLLNHSWPGNIRELKNVVARASALYPQGRVTLEQAAMLIDSLDGFRSRSGLTLDQTLRPLRDVEKDLIIARLEANGGNQRWTAKDLGIPKSTLHDKLKIYNINCRDFRRFTAG